MTGAEPSPEERAGRLPLPSLCPSPPPSLDSKLPVSCTAAPASEGPTQHLALGCAQWIFDEWISSFINSFSKCLFSACLEGEFSFAPFPMEIENSLSLSPRAHIQTHTQRHTHTYTHQQLTQQLQRTLYMLLLSTSCDPLFSYPWPSLQGVLAGMGTSQLEFAHHILFESYGEILHLKPSNSESFCKINHLLLNCLVE